MKWQSPRLLIPWFRLLASYRGQLSSGHLLSGEYSKPDKMPSLALAIKQSLLTPFWVTIRKTLTAIHRH